jgi:ElaB/YqjD/DUF883 family membrane-anchored ribosome-binding protein
MKQQNNCSPSKSYSNTKGLDNFIEKEISNVEFQKIIVIIINEVKEVTHKLVSELKEDMNKQLKELKENSNKQMNEIKKAMQDTKGNQQRYRNPEK